MIKDNELESKLLDYIEGTLSEEECSQIETLLQQDASLKEMLSMYDADLKLTMDEGVVYEKKSALKHGGKPLVMRWVYITMTAAAVLLLVLGLNNTSLEKDVFSPSMPQQGPASSPQVVDIDPINNPISEKPLQSKAEVVTIQEPSIEEFALVDEVEIVPVIEIAEPEVLVAEVIEPEPEYDTITFIRIADTEPRYKTAVVSTLASIKENIANKINNIKKILI